MNPPPPTLKARVAIVGNEDDTLSTYTVDATTGMLRATGTIVSSSPVSLAVHPNGRFAYVANFIAGTVSVFSVDTSAGTLMPVGSPVAAGTSPRSSPWSKR